MHEELSGQLLWIGGAMLVSVLFGAIARKWGQPRVLGALLGGLAVGIVFTNTHLMHEIRSGHSPFIVGLAELAAMLLLFKAGLEGNLHSILKDARFGWKVAVIGVVVPIAGGAGYTLIATDVPFIVALFQGGVFAATSVGITAAVLGELKVLDRDYARTIISAAVIDDVLGLIILTVCSALNSPGGVDAAGIGMNIASAVLFVFIVPFASHLAGPRILRALGKMDVEAREAIVLAFMVLYGAAALYAGLAAIVGAYFAGVALEEIYFDKKREHDTEHAIEHFVDDLITGFGPIFFVYAGCAVNPAVFLNPAVLVNGIAFTVIAFVGKVASGLAASENRMIIGVGMAPRGEVGIVFATIGLSSGILTQELFGASMMMVLLTTVVTPPLLNYLIKRKPTPVPAGRTANAK